MKVIIDRFESDYAVVEKDEKEFYNIPRVLVSNAKEGDVIDISVDQEETNKRRMEVEDLMNDLFKD